MRKIVLLLIVYLFITKFCEAQSLQDSILHNKDFKWTILIPEGFTNVDPKKWDSIQNRGATLLEDTYGKKIENNTKSIFTFKSNQFDYFESCYQPFDSLTDGNYIESCKGVSDMLYETFKKQIPNSTIDTSFETEEIDELLFQKFKMKITYLNNMVFNVFMYTRLFGKKEFIVNIMYMDDIKGFLMLNAFKKSKFLK